ncbi:MAG: beta-ketoacyl-ACP synthase I, partial [Gammaproteobacteria bacterium]|nr:beta-ketoacyl-ACP synthase I [Gammaproteobacteria bacterium]
MKRAVITGMGIVSPLGNSVPETLAALQATRSGIQYQPLYEEIGLRSHIAGSIEIDQEALIDRKLRRFMGDAAAFSYIALKEALVDSGLEPDDISNERTGIVAGSGGASSSNLIESADILREKGLKRVGPYRVTRTMSSTV